MPHNRSTVLLVACLAAIPSAGAPEPVPGVVQGGAAHVVDGGAGRNSNTGSSPGSPWQDFSNLNGRTLNAGDRLLIKRGSVINQERRLSARGTADRWVEIAAYGEGARPVIRRNWDIADHCAVIKDPDFLRIRGLVFNRAGERLVGPLRLDLTGGEVATGTVRIDFIRIENAR